MESSVAFAEEKCWAYRSLLSKKEGKVRVEEVSGLGIADVVLRKKGRLHWVCMNKRGKVVHRKKFQASDVSQKFFRLSNTEGSNQVHDIKICRVTWEDQSTTAIDLEAFDTLLQQNGVLGRKKADMLQPIYHSNNVVDVAYADSTGLEIIKQAQPRPGSARLIKRVSREVVKRIEEMSGMKVDSMLMAFVAEDSGRAILVDMSQIHADATPPGGKTQFLPEIAPAEKDPSRKQQQLRCNGDFCGYLVDQTTSYNILLLSSPETNKTPSIHGTIRKSALLLARAEMGYITGAIRQLESALRDDSEFALSWQKLDSKLSVDLRKKSGEMGWNSQVPVCANCHAVYSKIHLLRSSGFRSEPKSSYQTPRIEPAEQEFFSRQIAELEAKNAELLRNVKSEKSRVREAEGRLRSNESRLSEKLEEMEDAHGKEEKAWVEAMTEKDDECERLLLEMEALKHSLLSASTSNDTQDAIAYARKLEDSKSSLLQRLRELNQRVATVESEKLRMESRLNGNLSSAAEAEEFSTLLDQERKLSKGHVERIASLERQFRDAVRAKGRVEAERDDLTHLKTQRELDVNELRKSQAELRIQVAKLSSSSNESKENTKAKHDAKLMQALNELDFVRSQLASEVSCKEELSKTIADASEEIAKAKAAAGRTEHALRQKYEVELKQANARLEKKVEAAQKEAKMGEEKLRLLQRNLHELTQDLGTARRRVESLSEDKKRSESLRQKLESDNRALLQNMEELQQSMLQAQSGSSPVDQPVTRLRSQKAQAEADLRKVESEVRYWKNQAEIEKQLRKDAEAEAADAQQRLETVTEKQLQEKERLTQQLEATESTQRKVLAETASKLKAEVAEREAAIEQNTMLESKISSAQEALQILEAEATAKGLQLVAANREVRALEQELGLSRVSKAKEHEVNRAAIEALEQTIHDLERDQERQKRIASDKLVQVHSSMKESTRKLLAVTEQLKETEMKRRHDRVILIAIARLNRVNVSVKARALLRWRNTNHHLRTVTSMKTRAAEEVEAVILERQEREKKALDTATRQHKEELQDVEERGKMVNEDLYKEYCQAYEDLSMKLKEERTSHVHALEEKHTKTVEELKAQHLHSVEELNEKKEALEVELTLRSEQAAEVVKEKENMIVSLQGEVEKQKLAIEQLSTNVEAVSTAKDEVNTRLEAERRASTDLLDRLEEEKRSKEEAAAEANKEKQQLLDQHAERLKEVMVRATEEREAAIAEMTKSFESKLEEIKHQASVSQKEVEAKHSERVSQMARANQSCIDSLMKEHNDVVESLEQRLHAAVEQDGKTREEWRSKLLQAESEQGEALLKLTNELMSVREEAKNEQASCVKSLEDEKREALSVQAVHLSQQHDLALKAAKEKWVVEIDERLETLRLEEEHVKTQALKEVALHWQNVVKECNLANGQALEKAKQQHEEQLASELDTLKKSLSSESDARVRALQDEAKRRATEAKEAHAKELAATIALLEKEKQERVEAALRDLQNTHDRILSINEAQHQANLQQVRESSEAEKQSAVAACAKEAAAQMLAELKRIKAEEATKMQQARRAFESREQKLLEECDSISEQRLQQAERAMEQSVTACRERFQTRLDSVQLEKDEAVAKASAAVSAMDKKNKAIAHTLQLSQLKLRIAGVYTFLLRMKAIRAVCTLRSSLLSKGKVELSALRRDLRSWVNEAQRPHASALQEKITSIRQQLKAIHDDKRTTMKQEQRVTKQLRIIEAEVGRVEGQLREISLRSVIRRNGQVNEGLARQKRSLDTALERSLQTVTALREKRDGITSKLRSLRDQAKDHETLCEDLAKQLFELLLKRQTGIIHKLRPNE